MNQNIFTCSKASAGVAVTAKIRKCAATPNVEQTNLDLHAHLLSNRICSRCGCSSTLPLKRVRSHLHQVHTHASCWALRFS